MTLHRLLASAASVIALALASGSAAGHETDDADGHPPAPAAWQAHELTVRGGVLPNPVADVEVSTASVSSDVSGILGTIQYDYWARDEWAIGVAAGVFDASVGTSIEPGAVTSSVASITMVQLGVTYRPVGLSLGRALRPFASLSAGPYVRSFVDHRTGRDWYAGVGTSTAPGARVLIGLDLRFAGHFKVGVAGGYHAIGRFDDPIGGATDYSGPEFSIGFGVGFGGGS